MLKKFSLFALLVSFALAVAAQSNVLGTLLTSAARTVTTASSDVTNTSYRGAHVVINVTSYTSGTWTPVLQGKDPISANYYDICTGPAIAATGMTIVKVYPGISSAIENAPTCNDFLPRTWRINMVGATSPSATFSVSYLADY